MNAEMPDNPKEIIEDLDKILDDALAHLNAGTYTEVQRSRVRLLVMNSVLRLHVLPGAEDIPKGMIEAVQAKGQKILKALNSVN